MQHLAERSKPIGADSFRLSRAIKDRATAVGFDKVGIVGADALQTEHARLKKWLELGYHGEMKWMARDPDLRADPRKFFPEVRSVVVVALNYYTPAKHIDELDAGKVSRYAWGDDYHDVLGSKLTSLLAWIKGADRKVAGKVCVDIQPMMDKAWAVRAGIGWIGKHTNLITQDFGSWVFLGELLLNVDLQYDTDEVEDHCGSCTLCIDACPTDAITEPYVLDSNKCISHATIELRDPELPESIAANLNGWLYGCDICQDVCPWNRFEQPSEEKRFQPRPGNFNASLPAILQMTHERYVERFRHSAMKRAKLAGLQRNARALQTHK